MPPWPVFTDDLVAAPLAGLLVAVPYPPEDERIAEHLGCREYEDRCDGGEAAPYGSEPRVGFAYIDFGGDTEAEFGEPAPCAGHWNSTVVGVAIDVVPRARGDSAGGHVGERSSTLGESGPETLKAVAAGVTHLDPQDGLAFSLDDAEFHECVFEAVARKQQALVVERVGLAALPHSRGLEHARKFSPGVACQAEDALGLARFVEQGGAGLPKFRVARDALRGILLARDPLPEGRDVCVEDGLEAAAECSRVEASRA
jgi:hypothetical protein